MPHKKWHLPKRIQTSLALGFILVLMGCMLLLTRDYHHIITRAERWVAYYGSEENPKAFLPYNVIVFDAYHHPKLEGLKSPKRILLGYVSFGEEATHYSLPVHQQEGVRLKQDKRWGEQNYILDLRATVWRRHLLEKEIPKVLSEGFDGIMIDTIEAPLDATRSDKANHEAMREAAITLVQETRKAYPDIPIMLNRGFEILPQVADSIDMVLGESIRTDYDFASATHHFRDEKDAAYVRQHFQNAKKQNPRLRMFSLNYWPEKDASVIQQIYHLEREAGHVPYVSTILLKEHFIEPRYQRKI
jgi:endo-alpha-1,4-polygalactosaminidase (GH114 family)